MKSFKKGIFVFILKWPLLFAGLTYTTSYSFWILTKTQTDRLNTKLSVIPVKAHRCQIKVPTDIGIMIQIWSLAYHSEGGTRNSWMIEKKIFFKNIHTLPATKTVKEKIDISFFHIKLIEITATEGSLFLKLDRS